MPDERPVTLDELKATLDSFSPVQIEFAAKVIGSLTNPPRPDIRRHGIWLTEDKEWIEYFGLALSLHHSATTDPLGLTAFEAVFRNACDHLGWPVDPPGSRIRRFVDLTVRPGRGPERRLSLKSTAAKRLSKTALHISKLTEATWIQDARTERDRQNRIQELFRQYQSPVTHIIMLRASREDNEHVPRLYQIVEIPADIFNSIQRASLTVFERDAPLIECEVGGHTVAAVAIDRSDAKVTVRRVQLSTCTIHAEWSRT